MTKAKSERTKLSVSYFAFTVFALIAFLDESGMILITQIAALMHELGHLSAMYFLCDIVPERIYIGPFGMKIHCKNLKLSNPASQLIVYAAGPAINLLVFILCYKFEELRDFSITNLSLALFNLLPVAPLDGSNLLLGFLKKFFNDSVSERISDIVTLMLLLPLATVGFIILFNTKNNFSVFALSVYLLIMFIVRKNMFHN